MANFNQAYQKMKLAEYSNKEYLFLHYLNDEKGYTLGGIYQQANPNAIDWNFIDGLVKYVKNIRRVAVFLYYDKDTQLKVYNYFKKHYWDKSRLDEIQSQKVAEEIYMASVLYGTKKAIMMAQKIAQTKQDGILGDMTLKGINNVKASYFDELYDTLEIQLAQTIANKYNKENYLNGWINRANDSWDLMA